MSDTTPNDGKTNPETDAPDATPEHREPEAVDDDAATDPAETGDVVRAPAEPYGYTGTGSHSALTAEHVPDPVAADALKRETYLPSATDGGTAATFRSDDSVAREQYPEYNPAQPVAQTPIYVQAPTPPRNRGNRGFGLLVALLATVVYAALYALASFIMASVATTVVDAATRFGEFAVQPVFYVPVIVFFLALALLIALVNRGGWWAYVLVGFLVAVIVYFSFIGGGLLTVQVWNFTPAEAASFVSTQWLHPSAIAAAIIAREVPIWAGAWIARRGRRITTRNVEARHAYDRKLAEGPQPTPQA